MRRAHFGEGYGGFPEQAQVLEEENDHLENSLREKVKELKVVYDTTVQGLIMNSDESEYRDQVTIKIGNEVRSQNDFLHGMENDFDNTGGFLQSTMNRVTAMAKAGHNRYIVYLFLFSLSVFFVIWVILKSR
ncbi:hypothetical protein LSAT2_002885 [Lamellibrachia satsuma]|nr:hypothetical protein LSAT2_002885 [Lamellibrachia satsuma]